MTIAIKRPTVVLLACALTGTAWAAAKGTQFWNLTATTVTHLQLAPAGTRQFGPDQCKNDPDGTVDPDERLKITGIDSGLYDVEVAYKGGKVCTVKGVAVEKDKVFSVEVTALTDCAK